MPDDVAEALSAAWTVLLLAGLGVSLLLGWLDRRRARREWYHREGKP